MMLKSDICGTEIYKKTECGADYQMTSLFLFSVHYKRIKSLVNVYAVLNDCLCKWLFFCTTCIQNFSPCAVY